VYHKKVGEPEYLQGSCLIGILLAIDESKVTEMSKLVDDLDADSLNKFSIVSAVEEEFKIDLDDEEAMEIETVSDLDALIEK
jgi:acyl carrier protein